ncbi:unnamed protein product [Dracunculus medinensis]|uniref:Hexosyltransferase n=1 Tax=Dracunculus medinensis TaxID=318479 RepID=A0A0N4UMC7_DRAME|nr:unnamed protein product [Dracunculus medinensis]
MRVEDIKKLSVLDHSCLRYILRIRRADKISQDLRSNTICINNVITECRLRWLGYILGRPPQELMHISLFAKPCDGWRQKRGGPIKTWTDTVRKDFERIGGPAIYGLRRWKKEWLSLLSTMASDRATWKRLTLVAVGASLTSNVGKEVKVVVYMSTRPQDFELRKALRDFWTNEAKMHGIEVVFAMGRYKNDSSDIILAFKENLLYGDIFMANYEDTYKNLILKYWMNLHYHVHYCHQTNFMVHADSDTVIFAEKFASFMNKYKHLYENKLGCQPLAGPRITNPNNLWYVSADQEPWPQLMRYCHGFMILSSNTVAKKLLDGVEKIGIDYFTSFGIFDVATDVEILEIDGLYHSMPELDNVCNESTLAIHYMKEVKAIEITINKSKNCSIINKGKHADLLQ